MSTQLCCRVCLFPFRLVHLFSPVAVLVVHVSDVVFEMLIFYTALVCLFFVFPFLYIYIHVCICILIGCWFCLAGCALGLRRIVRKHFYVAVCCAVWFVLLDKHFSAKQIRLYLTHTNHACFRLLRMRSFVHTLHCTLRLLLSCVSPSRFAFTLCEPHANMV